MGREPLVSVIIPTLNRAAFIGRAIASVTQNSYSNVELVVVDQGSDDSTLDLLESGGIRHLHDPVLGAGHARKSGLAATAGEFVVFLDSDDWLTPEALQSLVDALQSLPVEAVFGGSQKTTLGGPSMEPLIYGSTDYAPLTSSTMTRRSAFSRFGDFDDDNYSWPRWVASSREAGMLFAPLDAVVAHRGIHDDNVSKQSGATAELFALARHHRNRKHNLA